MEGENFLLFYRRFCRIDLFSLLHLLPTKLTLTSWLLMPRVSINVATCGVCSRFLQVSHILWFPVCSSVERAADPPRNCQAKTLQTAEIQMEISSCRGFEGPTHLLW